MDNNRIDGTRTGASIFAHAQDKWEGGSVVNPVYFTRISNNTMTSNQNGLVVSSGYTWSDDTWPNDVQLMGNVWRNNSFNTIASEGIAMASDKSPVHFGLNVLEDNTFVNVTTNTEIGETVTDQFWDGNTFN